MSDVTVTISIGRNVDDAPMSATAWSRFRADVRESLNLCDGTLYVDAAQSVGEWEGVREDSATFVAAVSLDCVPLIRADLHGLCLTYGQDAIALTVGTTELVG
jgi:hypothetical protein